MKCVNCNNEINVSDKFCGRCGMLNPAYAEGVAAVNTDTASEANGEGQIPQKETEKPKKEKKTAPLWLCILCIIIIFILSIACGALAQMQFGDIIVNGVEIW